MITPPLTRDAEKFFTLLYKAYLEKREMGETREAAKSLSANDDIFLKISRSDLKDYIHELKNAEYLEFSYLNSAIYRCKLTNRAIIQLENKFENGLLSVVDYLAKFA